MTRFQAAPKESHIIDVKRIIHYLKGTKEYDSNFVNSHRNRTYYSFLSSIFKAEGCNWDTWNFVQFCSTKLGYNHVIVGYWT